MGKTTFNGGSLTVYPNGQLLRELRLKENKIQRQVEDSAGIPSPRLSTYEAGKPISINHIISLSQYYGVSAKVLTSHKSVYIMSELGTVLVGMYGYNNSE